MIMIFNGFLVLLNAFLGGFNYAVWKDNPTRVMNRYAACFSFAVATFIWLQHFVL